MRPLSMAAAIAVATITVLAYPLVRHTATTGPADELTRVADNNVCPRSGQGQDGATQRGVSEITWFQGTLEEAFARHSHNHSHHRPSASFHF